MKIVIVGATSSIAEHCARLWVASGAKHLVLLARDPSRLAVIAADLSVRSPDARIETQVTDFMDPKAIASCVEAVATAGPVDVVLIAHGSLPDQAACQSDPRVLEDALLINGISPVLFAEAFARQFEQRGSGTLALIGSVAGDRGRKSNYAYGAAKGLVERYVQGLQHRFGRSDIKVILIKPGPTDTPMTAKMKSQGARLAPVTQVAASIVAGIAKGRPIIYAPAKWALIMMVIRHLPRWVFNKMDI